MLTNLAHGASVTAPPLPTGRAPSLAEHLFRPLLGDQVTVVPAGGSDVACQHCRRTAFRVIGDCIVVVQRHDGQYHKTVVALSELGLQRMP